ncbi:hypothetical protein BpHYR1_026518 [Brachionus plicatilis]|uniref:Uncharacterized protein n=1 Tax=Brachionus plicatilis TaxID=10195 RepID=A0A3M7QTG9_BRAPC|nr:hypothetical protein BpHYR1_026518 [Brachionus plicatilis]
MEHTRRARSQSDGDQKLASDCLDSHKVSTEINDTTIGMLQVELILTFVPMFGSEFCWLDTSNVIIYQKNQPRQEGKLIKLAVSTEINGTRKKIDNYQSFL